MPDPSLRTSAQGATYLILQALLSRGLTFAINQLLLRLLTPSLLGASVQLDLYATSVLYFARESLRIALQRHRGQVQPVVNAGYLALASGVPLSIGFGALYLWVPGGFASAGSGVEGSGAQDEKVKYLPEALAAFGFAALLELASEPAFVAAQHLMLFRVRAAAESAATVAKCGATAAVAVGAARSRWDAGVLPFAAGQVAYAVVLLGVYGWRMGRVASGEGFSLGLRGMGERERKSEDETKTEKRKSNDDGKDGEEERPDDYVWNLFSRPLVALAVSMTMQSTLKYWLTQGDGFLIASLASLSDQGAYALASNYGSLIARMLFQPVEEASRNLFAKLCAPLPSNNTSESAGSIQDISDKNQKESNNSKPNANTEEARVPRDIHSLTHASKILHTILHLYTLLSLPLLTLGPALSTPLLTLIAGPRWSHTPAASVLAAYALYIPFMAVNGVSEAFVAAVADAKALRAQSAAMFVFSGVFAGAAWVFIRGMGEGGRGLVWANMVNMAARGVWNVGFIRAFFKREGGGKLNFSILSVLPSAGSVAATAAVPPLLRATEGQLRQYGVLGELVRVGGIAGVFCVILLVLERRFLLECYRMVRPGG